MFRSFRNPRAIAGSGQDCPLNRFTEIDYQKFQRSLKSWMGFVRQTLWSVEFDCPAVTVLARLLDPQDGAMDEFLARYEIQFRPRYRLKVKKTVMLWLVELAFEDE